MTPLENLLRKSAVRTDFHWRTAAYGGAVGPWDRLASADPILAVGSAISESAERRKITPTIEFLRDHLLDGTVLDLGCGYGRIAKYLLPQRTFDGYIGVDGSQNMLKVFHDRYTAKESERRTPLLLLHSSIEQLDIEDNSVDNIVTMGVYLHNHKEVVKRSINEACRVLKPGGKMFLLSSFPNIFSFFGLQGSIYLWCLKISGDEYRNGPVRLFSEGEVRSLLRDFKDVEIRRYGFAVLPKDFAGFPSWLNTAYRWSVYYPIQEFLLEKIAPQAVKGIFCTHFDAIVHK